MPTPSRSPAAPLTNSSKLNRNPSCELARMFLRTLAGMGSKAPPQRPPSRGGQAHAPHTTIGRFGWEGTLQTT